MDSRFLDNSFSSGLGGILGGLFGNSGEPYNKAMDQYGQFINQGKATENPFYSAGTGAIPQYQQWLKGMQDPSSFINNLMGKYQESPWAKYQQQQAVRSAQNMGSQSGLTGSTPMTQFAEQNAQNISSQDMNQWLQNVLGINKQYGAGQEGLIGNGQNSANSILQMLSHFGDLMGEGAYGKEAGENQDKSNLWGGLINAGMSILPAFL